MRTPTRAPLLFPLAVALSLGACGGASSQARGAQSPDPLDSITAEDLFHRGAMLARAGDFTRAEQYLSASMERGHPEDEVIPVLLNVCVQASRLVAALDYAEPYLARHPQNWPLRMLTATIHMGLEHHERARIALERVLEDADEEPAQAHYLLGVLYRDAIGDDEAARGHFERYLELDPEGAHRDEAASGARTTGRLPVRVAPSTETPAGTSSEAGAEASEARTEEAAP